MIAIEVFRPDEMALVIKQRNTKTLLAGLAKGGHDTKDIQPDNPYFKLAEDEEVEDIEPEPKQSKRGFKFFEKTRSNTKKDKKESKMQKQADK